MGVKDAYVTGDPLTTAMFHWDNSDCDCCAKVDSGALHDQLCNITPIYAELVPPGLNMIIGSFHAAKLGLIQTVIKCAQCGKERLGKDLDVIYSQSPMVDPQDWHGHMRNAKRVVKAVCPEHNRRGVTSFRRAPLDGMEY